MQFFCVTGEGNVYDSNLAFGNFFALLVHYLEVGDVCLVVSDGNAMYVTALVMSLLHSFIPFSRNLLDSPVYERLQFSSRHDHL